MNDRELLLRTAAALKTGSTTAATKKALVGLDGFVDEIIRVVDKRETPTRFKALSSISQFGERIRAAAGKSTNIEFVVERVKLGGNGPIMANALVSLGVRTTYVGALGHPDVHEVFRPLAARARVVSVCNPAHTDALEFGDGKIMLGKLSPLSDLTWECLVTRVGRAQLQAMFDEAALVAMTNWTMLPFMSDIWQRLQAEICPKLREERRLLFIDLADPTKRRSSDLRRALALIKRFERWFSVTLGLNRKEAALVAQALGIDAGGDDAAAARTTAQRLQKKLGIGAVVVHSRADVVSASRDGAVMVGSAFTPKPLLSTGAGDHFNAGYCLGRLLGFDEAASLQTGVGVSGLYVRTGRSPSREDVAAFLRKLARV